MRKLLEQRLALLDSVPDKFITATESAERKAIREAISLLTRLDTKDGRVIQSSKNYQIAEQIHEKAKRIFSKDLRKAHKSFLKQADKINALNIDYFSKLGIDAKFDFVFRAGKANATRVLFEGAIQEVEKLRAIIDIAIGTGGSIDDVASQLRRFGFASRHARTHAVDVLTAIDATYSKVLADEHELDWFQYVGGLIKDSRCFCVERNANYYHRSEVESWGDKPSLWDKKDPEDKCGPGGRNPATTPETIWVYRGGYNCRHILSPTAEQFVPKEDLARIGFKFVPAKTIEEAKRFAETQILNGLGGENAVDYGNITDLDVINEINKTLLEAGEKYDLRYGRIETGSRGDAGMFKNMNPDFIMFNRRDGRIGNVLGLNEDWFNQFDSLSELEDAIKEARRNNWTTGESLRDLVYHELGHRAHKLGLTNPRLVEFVIGDNRLGRYAFTDIKETLAEIFAYFNKTGNAPKEWIDLFNRFSTISI